MKKVESVLNDSPGCVKTSTPATFPQILFALLSLILPEKFKMKGGKENAEHTAPSQLLVLKHIAIKLLILLLLKKEDLMRLIKFTSFLILISLLIPLNLFPWISSRVEGTIVDEETGQPITGAYVGLFYCKITGYFLRYTSRFNTKSGSRYIETNDKGYFRFDDLREREYFLAVFKDGYAAVGPFYYKKPGPFEDSTGFTRTLEIERFHLKEGQIKHFKIQMEKESILKVNVLRKTFEGIEAIDEFQVSIKHSDFVDKVEEWIIPLSNKNPVLKKYQPETNTLYAKKYIPTEEGFQSINFKKGTVNIEISPNGYPPKTFENIQLEKGEVKLVEWIVDFTRPPVVYGIIKNKDTGKPFHVADLHIQKQDEPNKYFFLTSRTDKNGKFWLGGIEPGKYLLRISSIGGDKEFKFKTFLEINKNSIIEMNKNF